MTEKTVRALRESELPSDVMPKVKRPILSALKNLRAGTATPDQQAMALDWIIQDLCLHGRQAYRTDDRDTVFICGRQFVAGQIIGALNINLATLRSEDEQPTY